MDLIHLETFYHVGKLKSFTLAGKRLNLSQPTISRRIGILEKELNTKLLTRKNRGGHFSLTSDGILLFEHAEKMIKAANAVKTLISNQKDSISGELKILAGPSLAAAWVPRFLPKFLEQYPDIRLSIEGALNPINSYIFDILIQPQTHNPDFIEHKLVDFNIGFYASKEYLKHQGTPTSVDDLDHHKIITYDDSSMRPYHGFTHLLNLGRENREKREPYIRVNSSHALLTTAKEGLGIAELAIGYPEYEKANLVRVLKDIPGPTSKIYLSYHKSLTKNKKVQAFKDFILKAAKEA